jgi:hypothetical protein
MKETGVIGKIKGRLKLRICKINANKSKKIKSKRGHGK